MMASTKLSRIFGVLRRYNRTPDCERSPEQIIEDFKEAADEASQDPLLASLRFFDESLQALEEDLKPSSTQRAVGDGELTVTTQKGRV